MYIAITKDKYELPIAVADTAKELAEMVGTKPNTVLSAISHEHSRGSNSMFKKVLIDESEE